jgi:methyl-accepting chemotaxis protein
VGQINDAMSQLSQATQQNSSSSEELAATAESMSDQAEKLQTTMSFFSLEGGPRTTAASVASPASRSAGKRIGDVGKPASRSATVTRAGRELDESHFIKH